ncbi:hypothetical protein J7T55_005395 [Diaporthe amygdali]|uniref:uncharacterized protein n=1 Tax=Phomopsis amygdali TaxID=1214568 RepID=UPI0022FED2A4|nr:uncharacterized protein J7T55_005395 [Diaporthe amygdali]KAJ0108418.1 hypothetical protein J7T55_005395 [Diaporthe amygdali]
MIVDQLLPRSTGALVLWLLVGLLVKFTFNKYGYGLNKVPGPWLAGFTDLYRLFIVWGRRPELWHIRLHKKHGKIVRLGPNTVSIADPEAIKIVYGLNSGYVKSDFYPVQQTLAGGRPLQSLFNTTDEQFHARLRRAVSNAYAMSTLVTFEPLVDTTTVAFLEQLKKRFSGLSNGEGICDFGTWLQYYAFDVIGELTYSKRLGFVDRGIDVDHIIGNLERLLNYVSVVGQLPFLDRILFKNPIRLWMSKKKLLNSNTPVVQFARERMADRKDQIEKGISARPSGPGPERRDFLSRFIDARGKDPEFISEQRVLALTVANMFAGSDTTAISLRAIFYNLLRSPSAMQKLLAELANESASERFTKNEEAREAGLVKWNEVRELPYLSAVINEALRCHPAAGLPLERVVPAQGLRIDGHYIPGGSIVGCSAWVVHRDKGVFGSRPDEFRPERWIDSSLEQQAKMKNALLSFGAGARTCAGKNVSLLEMYKLVPAVLRTFEIELVDPETPLHLNNAWFVKQSGFRVRLREREKVL